MVEDEKLDVQFSSSFFVFSSTEIAGVFLGARRTAHYAYP